MNPTFYKTLLKDLSAELTKLKTTDAVTNAVRLNAYWQMGRRIDAACAKSAPTSFADFVADLARDLKLFTPLVYRFSKFHKLWPDGAPTWKGVSLSWDHHIRLFDLSEAARRYYWQRASAESWSRDQLREAIRNQVFEASVSQSPTGLKRDPDPLYIYKALVEKVVDGDTLTVRIDLGFNTWVHQKLRLRGINCSEMKAANATVRQRAEAARAFVENCLNGLPFVVLKTYQVDLHGRFVADVFYHPNFKNKTTVAQKGLFLNDEILKAGLADLV